jgi:pullulanase/glycogen debranching enzyme
LRWHGCQLELELWYGGAQRRSGHREVARSHGQEFSSCHAAFYSLAISASAVSADLDLYLALNAYWEPLRFELPPIPEDGLGPWRRWLDTFLESPDDICPISNAPLVAGLTYLVNPRSVVALARIAERFRSGIGSTSVHCEA